ncbi:hypothetical protein [Proteus hauseri]|uniref:hypothetical protein n=1 Tax=Proteus hauseri TaxID=183417 RepID=UPI0010094124|nr:hypothetical protein [Proteus hauseri]QAV23344.1 hypothetical protein PH4a_08360 [Proteus hauseri]
MANWLDKIFGNSSVPIAFTLDFPEISSSLVPSLFSRLQPYEIGDSPLPDALNLLSEAPKKPDKYNASVTFSWSAGAREGLILHQRIGRSIEQYPSDKHCEEFADLIYNAIKQAIVLPDKDNLSFFYTMLCQDKLAPITYLPLLILKLEQDNNIDKNDIYYQLFLWILTKSPDQNPVKIALALLSHFSDSLSQRLLMLFMLHPEFTLYSIISLKKRLSYEEFHPFLSPIGQRTKGWGRIQYIEHLPQTLTIEHCYWILTQGYKNNVMTEYVAYDCAVKGTMLAMLNTQPLNTALLLGCSDILRALLNGGPAKDIYDYQQGAETCKVFISQVNAMPAKELKLLYCVCEITDFVQNSGEDWILLETLGWNDRCQQQIMTLSQQVIQKSEWASLIIGALQSTSRHQNYQASLVAKSLRLDIWELLFSLQKDKPNSDWWYQLMQTDSSHKIERVVKLAEQQIDLTALNSRDDPLITPPPEYKLHHAVEYIMQDLGGFPGIGWSLIKRQLRSSTLRDRNMALNALSSWSEALLPRDFYSELSNALTIETNNDTYQRIKQFLVHYQDGK